MLLRLLSFLGLLAVSAGAQPAYVGSKACARCHREIASSYSQTAMGRSMARANQPLQLALAKRPAGVGRFRVFRRGNELYQSETGPDSFGSVDESYKLEYVVGSGTNGYGYIVKSAGRLVEAPLSFYTKSGKWDLSPGYDGMAPGFERPITAECVNCHSGRPQPVANRLGMYLDPPFAELAIGCENCHGPGQEHVASAGKAALVNPSRLPPGESEALCRQCHQGEESSANSDLLGHHRSMRLSRCYEASGGNLTCITCHDPHQAVPAQKAAAYFRPKCLLCHTDTSCRLPTAQRLPGDDCAGCHMQKRNVPEIPHAALTDHHIRIPLK